MNAIWRSKLRGVSQGGGQTSRYGPDFESGLPNYENVSPDPAVPGAGRVPELLVWNQIVGNDVVQNGFGGPSMTGRIPMSIEPPACRHDVTSLQEFRTQVQ